VDPIAEGIRQAVLDARSMDTETRQRFLRRRLRDPDLVDRAEQLLASQPERLDTKALDAMINTLVRSFMRSRDEGQGDER